MINKGFSETSLGPYDFVAQGYFIGGEAAFCYRPRRL